MRGKRRRRPSKKQYEQVERKEAQLELDARSESEDRQEEIKVLWGLDEQQLKAATKNPKEKQRKEQELKAQKLKPVLDSVRKLAEDDKIVARIRELIRPQPYRIAKSSTNAIPPRLGTN
jgi:hypothetical protein